MAISFDINNLPSDFSVASRGTFVTVPLQDLSPDILMKLVMHGLSQKVGDAAASALADAGFEGRKFAELNEAEKDAVRREAKASMTKVVNALLAGEWGVERTVGKSVDPVVAEIRTILRTDYKAAWIAANSKDGWKALEEAEIVAGIDKLFEDQSDDTKDAITAAATESLRLKAAAKSAVKGFKLAM